MDATKVSELRGMLERATPGPWRAFPDDSVVLFPQNAGGFNLDRCPQSIENAALIVAAVNALPALLDRIEAQDAEIARLLALLELRTELGRAECARAERAERERDALSAEVARLNAHLSVIPGRIEDAARWINDATRWDQEDVWDIPGLSLSDWIVADYATLAAARRALTEGPSHD